MKVPYLDLKAHHAPHRREFAEAIDEVVEAGAFAGGPFVAKFEEDFAAYCETPYCVGVGSGTEALWLALLAKGVGPGDEVITSAMTFIATAEAISFAGAKPVFVDIDEETYNLDPGQLEAALTPRTKAVIPVHLFGQMADMDPVLDFARANGLVVIEDAAQAHGARYKGRRAGSLGDAGCFSFYPGKNLGAFGEAGALVTNDPELYEAAKMLRDHGQTKKYYHDKVGWNGRMDGIQAAVLGIKLRNLDRGNELRLSHASNYSEALRDIEGIRLPGVADYGEHVFHIYAVRVPERDKVLETMGSLGVGCGIHYPIPVHRQVAYDDLGYEAGSLPVSEACGDEFLSLPMFPELTGEQIAHVAKSLHEAMPRKMHA